MFKSLSHLAHLARVGFVLLREGVFAAIPAQHIPVLARPFFGILRLFARRDTGARGDRLIRALNRLGPSYVKLGQFLATRPDLIGVSLALDLSALQDRMPSFPDEQARARIEASLLKPVSGIYVEFGPAIAAASVAQVHRAVVIDDGVRRDVAVKVLRPDIERIFTRDMEAQAFMARMAERFIPASRRLKVVEVIATLRRTVELEMDLRFEAAALSEMAENTRDDPEFSVPSVDWERSARDCLTLDWVEGVKLSDLPAIKAAGLDCKALGRIAMQNFLRHALRDGFFHADMHQGNLFATRESTLVAVDLGIMGRLGMKERRFLAEILYGFITRNYRRIAEVHFEAGYVPAHHAVESFAQALRAVGEKIHGRNASAISMADLLGLLFEITGHFDMETRTELVLLQKTMVVVEGVSRGLDPEFDMWSTSEPVIRAWIERHLGPVGKIEDIAGDAVKLIDSARRIPALIARSERALDALEAARVPASSLLTPGRLLMLGLSGGLILVLFRQMM